MVRLRRWRQGPVSRRRQRRNAPEQAAEGGRLAGLGLEAAAFADAGAGRGWGNKGGEWAQGADCVRCRRVVLCVGGKAERRTRTTASQRRRCRRPARWRGRRPCGIPRPFRAAAAPAAPPAPCTSSAASRRSGEGGASAWGGVVSEHEGAFEDWLRAQQRLSRRCCAECQTSGLFLVVILVCQTHTKP